MLRIALGGSTHADAHAWHGYVRQVAQTVENLAVTAAS